MSSQPDGGAAPRHDYDALFGDEPAAPATGTPEAYDAPAGDAEPYLPPNAPELRDGAPASPAAESVDVPARTVKPAVAVDTGRLYHSAGATGPATTGALPALRDGARAPAAVTAAPEPAPVVAAPEADAPAPTRFDGTAPAPGGPPAAAAAAVEGGAAASAAVASDSRGLTYLGVVIVVGVPTLLVGLAQAIISNRIGWLTGLVLLATSAYAAVVVPAADRSAAIVVPPLAFLVTTLVAGQLTLADGGSLLVREGFMIFRTLAENAPWVLAATALAAVIVLVRRRRASGTG